MWKKNKLLLSFVVVFTLLLSGMTEAALDVTKPGDTLQGVPNDNDWPGAESPPNAIDNDITTKYLHFKGDTQPTGFQVTPSTAQSIVVGLTFTTANDTPGRDPTAYELSGSNVSIDGPYTLIATGEIVDFKQPAEWPRRTKNTTPISVANTTKYDHYQLLFTAIRDRTAAGADMMQIAEVELLVVQERAYNPVPANGVVNMAKTVIQWTAGENAAAHNVYFGSDQTAVTNATPDSPEYIVQTNLLYCADVAGLQKPQTTYYWRIDEVVDETTTIKGDIWRFTTAPLKAHTPVPADGWPFADPNFILTWGPGFNVKTTAGHRVFFGTDATAVANATTSTAGIYKGAKSSPGYTTGLLAYDTTYYWRIDEVDKTTSSIIYKGDVWRFKTRKVGGGLRAEYHHWSGTSPPSRAAAFSNLRLTRLDPVINFSWGDPGSPDPNVNPDLFSARWVGEIEIPFTETYTFTSASDDGFRLWVNEQLIIDSWIDQGTTEHSGTIALTGGQRYTIQAEYYENGGGAVAQLYWASPSIARAIIPEAALSPPLRATRADPADDAVGVEDTPTLKWVPGMKALKHDVYFGTDANTVAYATTATAGIYKGRIDPNKYDITTPLVWGEEYFWRIDEVNTLNPESPWKGSIWSFTVADYLIVDEFEDYNDYTPKRIFENWIDGLGYADPPPGNPGNGSTSMVGYAVAPFIEQTYIRGGRQAMPMDYDNTRSPYYAETDRTFTTPQNWTFNGVKALSLWFRGWPASTGSFTEAPAGTYTIRASGTDIWDVTRPRETWFHDEFHYAYQTVSGATITAIARVESIVNTNEWAKAGVMLRDSLDANSPHVFVCMTPTSTQGAAFQYRTTVGAASANTQTTGISLPQYVKLEVDTAGARGYYSPDGVTWTQVGTQQTIYMTAPMYIGLAVTSHNAAATTTARFTNVSITGGAGVWGHQDIGIKSNIAKPLYVALQDSTLSKTAVITHPDPNAVLNGTYQEWNIPLSSFTGINPAAIKKIIIGVGNRSSPTPGGAGTIYIDDIRVYRPRCFPGLIKPPADFDNSCVVDYPDIGILTDNWLIQDYQVTPSNPGTTGLEASYQFENNLIDNSGKGHNGDPCGTTPTYTGGKVGQAVSLDGADYVNCQNAAGLDITNAVTISAWINLSITGLDQKIAGNQDNTTGGYKMGVYSDNKVEFEIRTSTNAGTLNRGVAGGMVLTPGVWYHVAGVYSQGNYMRTYINGNLDRDLTTAVILGASTGTLKIGREPFSSASFFNGLIDELRVYSRALSQDEIAYLAGKTASFTQPLYLLLTPQDPAINLYNDGVIDLKDYAVLADTWLDELLWPQ
jgi:hypothetical protein